MADVHTPEVRSYNMSRVRGRDTRPELLIRRGLHARRYRFRLQARELPGRRDLVFASRRAVLFVHGCFWHGHSCPMFRLPSSRQEFWAAKIEASRVRNTRAAEQLAACQWRRLTVWECSLRGSAAGASLKYWICETFLIGATPAAEIAGDWRGFGSTK